MEPTTDTPVPRPPAGVHPAAVPRQPLPGRGPPGAADAGPAAPAGYMYRMDARISWPGVVDRAREIVEGYEGDVTLRQVHYRLVPPG